MYRGSSGASVRNPADVSNFSSQTRSTDSARSPESSGNGSEIASSWFGRTDASSGSSTSKQQPALSFQNRERNASRTASALLSSDASSESAAPMRSALYQSALTSTGAPWRGVIGMPS